MSSVRGELGTACIVPGLVAACAPAEVIYGSFNSSNNVVSFETANTGTLISNYPLSGPPPASIADVIMALSVCSDTGQLYGVSGTGVYTIDPSTGTKTRVAPPPLPTSDLVAGGSFQPGISNLFVISSSTRVEAITWGTPTGATTPALYGIDVDVGGLVAINPSNGQKTTIGPIPAFVGSGSGASFTYSDLTGTAYVNFYKSNGNRGTAQFLYTIDLLTGGTALVGIVDHFSAGLLQIGAGKVVLGPSCQVSTIVPGPPKQVNLAMRDTTSGLESIALIDSINASVTIPAFSPGTTDTVLVTATKIDQTLISDIAFRVTDMAGRITPCDPVDFTVKLDGSTEQHVFRRVNPAEDYIQIKNGTPGVRQMTFLVNGHAYSIQAIQDGETYSMDIGSAMLATMPASMPDEEISGNRVSRRSLGQGANNVVMYASGHRGSSAYILIGDALVLSGSTAQTAE